MIMFNLAEIMKERNISINKLSTETKINRASLTSIANNDSKMIQLSTIETLLNYLKIPLNEFVYDDAEAIKIDFQFERIDYLKYLCRIDYSYDHKHTSEASKLVIEKLSNSDIKMTFSELDYFETQWASKIGYGFTNDENLTYDVKDIFGTTSLEKQQYIGTMIFKKIMSNFSEIPNDKELGGNDNEDKKKYEEIFIKDNKNDLTEILENIDLTKNIYFIDEIFDGQLSNIYYSSLYPMSEKQIENMPPFDLLFSGGIISDIKVFDSDSSVLTNIKMK